PGAMRHTPRAGRRACARAGAGGEGRGRPRDARDCRAAWRRRARSRGGAHARGAEDHRNHPTPRRGDVAKRPRCRYTTPEGEGKGGGRTSLGAPQAGQQGGALESTGGKTGLVLAGGGARAAYQVGVLQALRDVLPDPKVNPYPIICGTSAGAVNAGSLAVYADDFGKAVDNLLQVWRHFSPHHVYRSDFAGVASNSGHWLAGFFFGALIRNRRVSMLDNRPLESLLARRLDFSR